MDYKVYNEIKEIKIQERWNKIIILSFYCEPR
jgi:hypothetical protein